MKITTDHPTSSYGIPVFLDDGNNPMNYSTGVKLLRKKKCWNTAKLAEKIGVSPRTIEDWEQGRRMPQKPTLLLMSSLI